MDTFPGLALAERILKKDDNPLAALSLPTDSIIGILDSDFHDPALAEVSLFDGSDKDLGDKTIRPTGIRKVTGPPDYFEVVRGKPTTAFDDLITSGGKNKKRWHGTAVAGAAAAAGEHLLGTGKHALIRPLNYDQAFGVCTLDRSVACDLENRVCPPDTGSCQEHWGSLEQFVALLDFVTDENPKEMHVLNASIAFDFDDETQNSEASSILAGALTRFVENDRIVVLAAGNEGEDASDEPLGRLAPLPLVDRAASNDPLHHGLLVVAGTMLPDASITDLLKLEKLDASHKPQPQLTGRTETSMPKTDFGAHVSVAAPGFLVPGMIPTFDKFHLKNGTSFAAPMVAGLAAELYLLDEVLPGRASPFVRRSRNYDIASIIEQTADDLGDPGSDDYFGRGRINVWEAILGLINRTEPEDEPSWFGVRYRSAIAAPTDRFTVNGQDVPDVRLRRVANVAGFMGDKSRDLPLRDKDPADFQWATEFSVESSELENNAVDGFAMLRGIREDDTIVYEIPVRLPDIVDARMPDAVFDDWVLNLDVITETSFVYGKVTKNGTPLSNATVSYTNLGGSSSSTSTDENGNYIIYDALPNETIDIDASHPAALDVADTLGTTKFRARRFDFDLLDDPDAVFLRPGLRPFHRALFRLQGSFRSHRRINAGIMRN